MPAVLKPPTMRIAVATTLKFYVDQEIADIVADVGAAYKEGSVGDNAGNSASAPPPRRFARMRGNR